MKSLDEAWSWYTLTKNQLELFGRLGRKYWDALGWDGPLGRDERFRNCEGQNIASASENCLKHLDDLAVLVLFSVFESVVRERVLSGIRKEILRISNQHVKSIVEGALDGIEIGSFFRILDVYKVDADLVEEVNQVRRYRNWVAHGRRSRHGRRSPQPASVTPRVARDRLSRFLTALDQFEPLES